MENSLIYLAAAGAAFGASWLTFYSGFGLGSILTAVFLLFFPTETAVAASAMVHLLNNVFKTGLTWGHADLRTALHFGIPSAAGAAAGAFVLSAAAGAVLYLPFSAAQPVEVRPVSMVMGFLLIGFAVFESSQKPESAKGSLALGGLISGFFGGLSGHQGALRSLYLSRIFTVRVVFVATGSLIALGVDLTRISFYLYSGSLDDGLTAPGLLITASAAAFAGAWTGNRLLHNVSNDSIRLLVKWGIIGIGIFSILRSFGTA